MAEHLAARLLVLVSLAGCRAPASSEPDSASAPGMPRAGVVADAVARPPAPKIGEFVLVRGGERLFARPDDASSRITLPATPPPFIGPIPAKVVAVRNGFIEVEMPGHAARTHCGTKGQYSDHLHGFVHARAIVDVTVTATRIAFPDDDLHLDVPPGIPVDRSGSVTVLEVGDERVTVPISEAAIGLSYPIPPRRDAPECLDADRLRSLVAAGRAEVVSNDLSADFTQGSGVAFVVHFESGERLGEVELPLARNLGKPHPKDARLRCTRFGVLSRVTSDATVCFDAAAFEKWTRPQPVANVRMGKHHVLGPLDPAVVGRVVAFHIDDVRHCYARGLVEDPSLAGSLTVAFAIESDGRARLSKVVSTTLQDAGVGECVAKAVRRWKFPSPEGGKTARVTFPFELSSSPPDG